MELAATFKEHHLMSGMRLALLSILSLLAANLILFGAEEKKEPWYRPPGSPGPAFSQEEKTRIPWIREISASAFRESEPGLCEKAAIPFKKYEFQTDHPPDRYVLDGQGLTFQKLLGGSMESPPEGAKLFLVRAVYYNPGTGGFSAYMENGKLLVQHHCLGKKSVPMKRTALVMALPEAPKEVYVGCGMDE
jgi:hypothetical protein